MKPTPEAWIVIALGIAMFLLLAGFALIAWAGGFA